MMIRTVEIPDRETPDLTIQMDVRPVRLTSEYVELQMLLVRVEAEEADVEAVLDAVHDRIVSVEGCDETLAPESIVELVGVQGVFAICTEIMAGDRVPDAHLQGVRKLLTIANRAQDYDPRHDPVCECLECAGSAVYDAHCLYRFSRPELSDILASYDWELLADCWDLPFYVYQLRNEAMSAQSKGKAAIYQESDRKRKKEDEAAKIREKHFGTSDWRKIGARND